jgi:small nuclear ribonucleoprotein (snRNP)-like protein
MEEKFGDWIGKKVFLVLKSGRKYSGVIKETTESFIFIIDKFSEKVVISISEISSLEEEKE